MDRCADSDRGCVFARALLAQGGACGRLQRRSLGERDVLECGDPQPRQDCARLLAAMRERARFALRLPAHGAPLMHAQALRLQCGGLAGLRAALDEGERDVQRLVAVALARPGGAAELPWAAIVAAMRAWAPRRRARADPEG